MDRIFIRGLQSRAVIGVHPWEREIRQRLLLDLELWWDCRPAAASDSLAQTCDYAAVAERIQAFVQQSQFQLIETLAEECAKLLLNEFALPKVRVTLHKPDALAAVTDLGITIERSAETE